MMLLRSVMLLVVFSSLAKADLALIKVSNLPQANKIYALAWDGRNHILYGLDHGKKQILSIEAQGRKQSADNKFGLDRVAYTLACDNYGLLWSDEVYTNLIHLTAVPESEKKIDGRSKFGPFEVIDLYFAGKLLYVLGVKRLRIVDPLVNNSLSGGCGVVVDEVGINTPGEPEEISWCRTLCADSKGNVYILTADNRLITVIGRKDAKQKPIPLKISETKVNLGSDIPSDCCYLDSQKQIVVAIPGLKPRLVGLSLKGETLWVHNFSDTKNLEPLTNPPLQPLAVCATRKDTFIVALSDNNQCLLATYAISQ